MIPLYGTKGKNTHVISSYELRELKNDSGKSDRK